MITSFYSATITRVHSLTEYDVRTNEGAIYRRVPLRSLGSSIHCPARVGDAVHIAFPRGRYDLPYIVGAEIVEDVENEILRAQPFIDSLFSYIAELESTIVAMQAQLAEVSVATGLNLSPTFIEATTPPSSSSVAKREAEGTISPDLKIK
jgi:hypothetical protein